MKKYLKEIELSGMILMLVGIIMYRFLNIPAGFIACAIGIGLWAIEIVYKAIHWDEYRRDNKMNIISMMIVIALLLGTMMLLKLH